MPLITGSLLNNRYRILEAISKGGMGSIYRAQDENLGVVIAVKENLTNAPEFAAQFHREASMMASLRHANLPRVTDHFIIENQGQYLVMDFIEGEDLKQRLTRLGKLSEEEGIKIAIAVCDALIYLHGRPQVICHRDIKPGNIKITPTGHVYLVDFGLAKSAQSGEATAMGARALSPGFAPPEQYGQGTDPRSDIYALGATLYSMLSGKVPEDGLERAVGSAQLIPLNLLHKQVSPQTAAVVDKAMSIKTEDRYPNALEFKNSLLEANPKVRTEYQQSTSIHIATSSIQPNEKAGYSTSIFHKPDAGASHPHPTNQRKTVWPLFASLGLVAILLVTGAIVLAGKARPQDHNPAKATPFTAYTNEPTSIQISVSESTATIAQAIQPSQGSNPTETSQPAVIESATQTPALIPSVVATPIGGGSGQVAFVSDRSGTPEIWLMPASAKAQAVQVTQLKDGACQPSWSPEGDQIVFISPCPGRQDSFKGSSLFIINADGSGLLPLYSVPGGDFDPAWSPDGERIAFTSIRSGRLQIYLYNLQDNSIIRLSQESTYDRHPAWSPDGQQIAFSTTRQGSAQIWVMNADGSSPREFSHLSAGNDTLPAWSPDGQVIVFHRGSKLPWLVAKNISDRVNEFPFAEDLRPLLDVDYSPDSRWLVFEHRVDNNCDLYMMNPNSANLTALTSEASQEYQPAWRP